MGKDVFSKIHFAFFAPLLLLLLLCAANLNSLMAVDYVT